jgi:hypothetical protein
MNHVIRNTTAALLLGCASLAHGAPIDPAVIKQAVRETAQEPVRSEGLDAAGKRPRTRMPLPQAAASSNFDNILARRLPDEPEQDSCLLNLGFNGTLGGRALSSHVLGRTQVWRDR